MGSGKLRLLLLASAASFATHCGKTARHDESSAGTGGSSMTALPDSCEAVNEFYCDGNDLYVCAAEDEPIVHLRNCPLGTRCSAEAGFCEDDGGETSAGGTTTSFGGITTTTGASDTRPDACQEVLDQLPCSGNAVIEWNPRIDESCVVESPDGQWYGTVLVDCEIVELDRPNIGSAGSPGEGIALLSDELCEQARRAEQFVIAWDCGGVP